MAGSRFDPPQQGAQQSRHKMTPIKDLGNMFREWGQGFRSMFTGWGDMFRR